MIQLQFQLWVCFQSLLRFRALAIGLKVADCAANATGKTVHSRPAEATFLGNIITQLQVEEVIKSLKQGREII